MSSEAPQPTPIGGSTPQSAAAGTRDTERASVTTDIVTTSHSDNPVQSGPGTTPPLGPNNPEVTGGRAIEETRVPGESQSQKDARLASRFAQLARRDKAIREEKKRLAAEKAQLARWQEAERLAKEDPLRLLESMGLTYEQLTDRQFERFAQQQAADDPVHRIKTVEEKIREFEELGRKHKAEQEKAQIEAALQQFQEQIGQRIQQEPERFELVLAQRAQEDVFRLIEAHFNETREVMPIEQAAQLVEDQLYEEAQAFLKAKKLQPKPPSEEQRDAQSSLQRETERSEVTVERVPRPNGHVTLTNTATAAGTSGLPKPVLDIEESKRRAAALLRWT